MNGNDQTASVEKKEKFRVTLQALTQLEEAVEQLKHLTNKLCGQIPEKESVEDKMREVDCVAMLLSDTPDRIARIEGEIRTCKDRLHGELS